MCQFVLINISTNNNFKPIEFKNKKVLEFIS